MINRKEEKDGWMIGRKVREEERWARKEGTKEGGNERRKGGYTEGRTDGREDGRREDPFCIDA